MTTLDRLLDLASLVITALGLAIKGNPTELEQALLAIARASVGAYEGQVGKPIDPSLIKPIEPLP